MTDNSVAIQFLYLDSLNLNVDPNMIDQSIWTSELYLEEQRIFLQAFNDLSERLILLDSNGIMCEKNIELEVYEVAKTHYGNVRNFFLRMYQILFSSNNGPRLPTFIYLLGWKEFLKILSERIDNPSFLKF